MMYIEARPGFAQDKPDILLSRSFLMKKELPGQDKLLFTPGPLSTSAAVKQAMVHDMGSRDEGFVAVIKAVREKLLLASGLPAAEYSAIPLQGSGSMGVEAAIGTAVPAGGRLLVLENGAYGKRIAQTASILGIEHTTHSFPENVQVDPDAVKNTLRSGSYSHVAVIHSETTSGIINPIEAIGGVVSEFGCSFIVDAMSSFGGVHTDYLASHADWVVSSSNKCLESVPGLCFAIASKKALAAVRGNARSMCLDFHAQYEGFEKNGQFRFTPPVQILLALDAALDAFFAEGGVAAREARYKANSTLLRSGMAALGFKDYLPPVLQGWIISSFYYPDHSAFSFEALYRFLSNEGYLIYPGKVSTADVFRIGTIGSLTPTDFKGLLEAIRAYLTEAGITLPA